MFKLKLLSCVIIIFLYCCKPPAAHISTPLFDGKSFTGWEGDTIGIWRIQDSAIVGGSVTNIVPHNDFLCTTDSYANFRLQLTFMLLGDSGFINSGVQFRSKRLSDPAYEMTGYQADLGAGYWASLYDESRRNKTLAILDSARADHLVKRGQWNNYEILCENNRIRIFLNGE
ncbi:MAG: DUF1080 domain-containing protein, partial [Flavitalea sp.]